MKSCRFKKNSMYIVLILVCSRKIRVIYIYMYYDRFYIKVQKTGSASVNCMLGLTEINSIKSKHNPLSLSLSLSQV